MYKQSKSWKTTGPDEILAEIYKQKWSFRQIHCKIVYSCGDIIHDWLELNNFLSHIAKKTPANICSVSKTISFMSHLFTFF